MKKTKQFDFRYWNATKHRRKFSFFVVTMMVTGALWLSANIFFSTMTSSWSERRLNDLVDAVIVRAELALDNVIMAEVELIAAGHSSCGRETMSAVRAAIYRHSALVDIQISGPDATCQAFEEFGLTAEIIQEAKAQSLPARNDNFSFMNLANEGSLGLGIVWEFLDGRLMTAVIRTDALLFDMLPATIRDQTSIVMTLNDGSIVAQYPTGSDPDPSANDAFALVFVGNSERYPISAKLTLTEAAFANLNDMVLPLQKTITALLAGLLALLVARGLVRSPSERELLQVALRLGEIAPYFQPIVDLTTNKVVGCEVLARWFKTDGTQVPPVIFVPLAELTGQTDALTRALMSETGHALGSAISANPDFKVNFNITAKQLARSNFAEEFLGWANDYQIPRTQLVVELVERDVTDAINCAKAALVKLQSHGVRVAIDDVGTGQNGLALLQSLDADIIKIDKLFIDMIDVDESSRAISEMLVKIAKNYDMSLVAEGIERREQTQILEAMGINEGQGFYFSEPKSAADFLRFLEASSGVAKRNWAQCDTTPNWSSIAASSC